MVGPRLSTKQVSQIMWQRWKCVRCGREGRLEITWTAAQDGNGILRRLDTAHHETSPMCIGLVEKQRDVGDGVWQAGDLIVLDKKDPERWVWKSREGQRRT